jgi:hypothetical protein
MLRHLGRDTDRVAISNHRLLAFDGEHVTFAYKDYARDQQRCTMTLTAMELLRCLFSTFCRAASFAFGNRGFSRTRVEPPVSPAPVDASQPRRHRLAGITRENRDASPRDLVLSALRCRDDGGPHPECPSACHAHLALS